MKKIFKYIPITVILLLIILSIVYWDFTRLKFEDFSNYLFPSDADGKGELFKIILSVFGAIAVVYGLYISLRRAKAMERGVEKQSESINNQTQQLELSRKSQIDERFKNAIEHLGSDKEPIILGGIAELHQIAKENKENYSEVVFNILCSYIKSTADVYTKKADDINHRALQTIVNYLFKKNSTHTTYNHLVGNLSYTNLLGLDLTDCNFINYNLSSCYLPNLNGSDLRFSKLSNAILRTSSLRNVDFSKSDLMRTIFHYCKIENSIFDGSKISNTIFLECTIQDVNFDNIEFYEINFSCSYINNISIKNCSIISGDFSCAHIDKVDFSNLEIFGGCDFRAASFNDVTFREIITSSKFNGANYTVNEYPQLYDRRLNERLGKVSELEIIDIQYGKNETGILTKEDCSEIETKIKELEKKKIVKHKTNKKKNKGSDAKPKK